MELKKYAALLWHWSWLIGLLTLLGLAGGLVLAQLTPKAYQASLTVMVAAGSDSPLAGDYYAAQNADRLTKNYAQLLKSDTVLDNVINNLKLGVDRANLSKRVSTSIVRDTQLISLSVEDSTPEGAVTVAKEIVKEFQFQVQSSEASRYNAAKQLVQTELDNIQNTINQTQTSLDKLQPGGNGSDSTERSRLENLLSQNRATYASLFKSLQDAQVAGGPADTIANLNTQLTQIQKIIDSLQADLDKLTQATPVDIVERNRLEAQLTQNRNTQTDLLKKAQDLRLSETQNFNGITLASDPKPENSSLVRPKRELNMVLGAALGFMASLVAVFGLSLFKQTVSNPEEAEQEFGVAGLGVVAPGKRNKLQLEATNTKTGDANLSESFTVVSLNLEAALAHSGARSLLLTSPNSDHTTAATLVNLGKSLAQLGKSVILVDANLREPLSHHFFGLASTQGLTTTLTRPEDEMLDALVPTEFENFRLLPRGPLPPNPAKLLSSAEMKTLVERLKDEADLVLFNTPSLVEAADSLLLARLCDTSLVVVQSGKAKPGSLKKAATLFAQAGIKLQGFLWVAPGVKFEKKFSGQNASRLADASPLVPPLKVEKVEAAADSSVESSIAEPAEEREVGS